MPRFLQQHHRLIFYLSWAILVILQAYFTELQDDEAYYWVYSLFPAAGYFDHPPMIALLIRAGTFFKATELSIRFFPLILNILSIYITEKLIDNKDKGLFYAICYSVGILHLAGFFAVPDIPLVFFSGLLFLIYKKYLATPTWSYAILIGVVTALMLYSKYHGVLVLFFILLSNPRLFIDKKIITAGFVALICFLPHLIWQYNHGWISVKYHLSERSADAYDFLFTSDYLLGQLLLLGPLAGFFLWPISFIYKSKDLLEKAFKWVIIGFFIFFLISTLKGRVEANWTAPVIIPMMILAYRFLSTHANWRKWFYRQLPVSVIIIFFARIITVVNIIPAEPIVERYFAWKGWPQQLIKTTNGTPVVFNSNYQRASKYWFYSKDTCYSLNSFAERQNNYNYWPIEERLLGRPVYIMDIYRTDTFPNRIKTPLWTIGYTKENFYYSFVKVRFTPEQLNYKIGSSDLLKLSFTVTLPLKYKSFLLQHPEVDVPLKIALLDREFPIKEIYTGYCLQDFISKDIHSISIDPRLMKGSYNVYFILGSSDGTYTRNSEKVNLGIEAPNP